MKPSAAFARWLRSRHPAKPGALMIYTMQRAGFVAVMRSAFMAGYKLGRRK